MTVVGMSFDWFTAMVLFTRLTISWNNHSYSVYSNINSTKSIIKIPCGRHLLNPTYDVDQRYCQGNICDIALWLGQYHDIALWYS